MKEILIKVKDHDSQKGRTKEPIEIDHIRPQRKCFLWHKGGHLAKHCRSRSIDAIAQVKELETGEVCCWRCREVGHLKRNCRNSSRYQYPQHTKDKISYQGQQNKNQGN